jgi:hypothetical protein
MDPRAFRDVVACLPRGRTLFHYERDRFAVQLLDYLMSGGWSAADIRASTFRRLLDRPPVRDALASAGRADFRREDVVFAPLPNPVPWRLSVAKWAALRDHRNRQVSRPGLNIVLQVNFAAQHNAEYRRHVSPANAPLFRLAGHPASLTEHTMAWTRIDADLDTGEALIEEIQSDWFKRASYALSSQRWFYRREIDRADRETGIRSFEDFSAGIEHYCTHILPRYQRDWQETTLAAALWFIVSELGIRDIYLHQIETGNRLKRINPRWSSPPQSVYTDLPRRFCFSAVSSGPSFIERELARCTSGKRKIIPGFWRLNLARASVNELKRSA